MGIGADGAMMFWYKTKDNYKCLSVYLSEYQSGKRVSHEKIAEIFFNGTESTDTGNLNTENDYMYVHHVPLC